MPFYLFIVCGVICYDPCDESWEQSCTIFQQKFMIFMLFKKIMAYFYNKNKNRSLL